MAGARDEIADKLAREEARLDALERDRRDALAHIAALRAELDSAASSQLPPTRAFAGHSTSSPHTPAEKVKLFRTFFRGRADVFPIRFVSRKTKKAGYAPECSNKWVPSLCALRTGGKCGDCANQAFVPVSDRIVLGHLRGEYVIGVYPLLEDETCWFLAVDFDKSTWKEDAAAFVDTSRSLRLPVAIERSRSGNGAHAWFFFAAPVQANVARRMGCFVITETMNRHHGLSMTSYDRLFPNQDTMPRGGFGNLIALPLQYESRQAGNSVFVDDRFEPFDDQWGFLASVSRIAPNAVEQLASEATRTGQVLGVPFANTVDDEEETAPWTRAPSGRSTTVPIHGRLPKSVNATLAQRLFIEKEGLPSALLNQLKRLAAFQNPEFYQKQRMRLSTALTPRVISCADELPRFVVLPRGCVAEAQALLDHHGVELALRDERSSGEPLDVAFAGELIAVQRAAADELLKHDTGVLVGPPGIGKTVLGTYLVARRARSTLILVHRRPLLDQWAAQLAMFLDLKAREIGQIGGGKHRPNGHLDVAMLQSLVRKERVEDLVASYGHVIIDECHHLPAFSFERVLSEARARFIVGLTATPQRRDGHHPITEMQLGPVRYKVDAKSQATQRPFAHTLVVRETAFRTNGKSAAPSIQEVYAALAGDTDRNQRIVDDVLAALEEGRSPVLLTERKDHVGYLAERLRPMVRNLVVLHGGMTTKQRRDAIDALASIPDAAERLVIATGRYIGEGFDDARLDTLFLAMPVSWKGTLIQYSGRLQRHHPGKSEVRIYDYVDNQVPVLLRMFEKRLSTYRAIGYARGEAPLGFASPCDEHVIEYDDDALRHFERDV